MMIAFFDLFPVLKRNCVINVRVLYVETFTLKIYLKEKIKKRRTGRRRRKDEIKGA